MIDIKAIRAAAEAATPIYTDLLGDRYFGNDHSTATLTKAQDDFISTANPATILALLDRLEAAEVEVIEQARLLGISAEKELALMAKLEAAEKDAARYRYLFSGDKVYTHFRDAYDFWDGCGGKDGFDAVVDAVIRGDL